MKQPKHDGISAAAWFYYQSFAGPRDTVTVIKDTEPIDKYLNDSDEKEECHANDALS